MTADPAIERIRRRVEQASVELRAGREQLDRIEALAISTNGRVREIEMWRARLQGAAGTARVVWLVAGGACTLAIVELVRLI